MAPEKWNNNSSPDKKVGRVIQQNQDNRDGVGRHQSITQGDQQNGSRGTEIEWEDNQEKEIKKD